MLGSGIGIGLQIRRTMGSRPQMTMASFLRLARRRNPSRVRLNLTEMGANAMNAAPVRVRIHSAATAKGAKYMVPWPMRKRIKSRKLIVDFDAYYLVRRVMELTTNPFEFSPSLIEFTPSTVNLTGRTLVAHR